MSTETQIYALAAGKQVAKGTALAAPTRRFIQVGGDFNVPQDLGSENFSDLSKFGDSTDWVNSVLGRGNPSLQADFNNLAWLFYMFTGSETVAANATVPALKDHVAIDQAGSGFYSTWWKRVGQSTIDRKRFIDCLISSIQLEASSANKALRVTPDIISLDPAENLASDPTWPSLPTTDKVLLYTEASGTFKIDTVTIRGHSQFTVTINEDLQADFTDDTVPYEVRRGNPTAQIACTIRADADGLAQVNKLLYGTTTPSAGQKPQKRVPAIGAYEFNMTKLDASATLIGGFKFEMPGVRWQLPDYPGPNPDGGEPTLAMAGSMRKVSGQPAWRTTVTNGEVAYT